MVVPWQRSQFLPGGVVIKCRDVMRIGDYPDEVLRASTNPFAAVMMVTKEGLLKVKGTDEERDNVLFEQKMLMVGLLKEKLVIFGERKTRAIIAFLNNYVVFKKPENNPCPRWMVLPVPNG
jgi:hypothetical protein